MQIALILLVVSAATATLAGTYEKSNNYNPGYGKNNYDYAPANYKYDYAVKDDYYYVNFGQNEERYGDNTKGYYYVDLPDNRRQVVNYYVDGYSGYVAEVKYEGEPKYSTEYKQGPKEYKPVVYTKPKYPKN